MLWKAKHITRCRKCWDVSEAPGVKFKEAIEVGLVQVQGQCLRESASLNVSSLVPHSPMGAPSLMWQKDWKVLSVQGALNEIRFYLSQYLFSFEKQLYNMCGALYLFSLRKTCNLPHWSHFPPVTQSPLAGIAKPVSLTWVLTTPCITEAFQWLISKVARAEPRILLG